MGTNSNVDNLKDEQDKSFESRITSLCSGLNTHIETFH